MPRKRSAFASMTPSRRPPPTHFRPYPVAETGASLSFSNPKLALKLHSAVLTAPAAHSKRLYRNCSGIRLAPQSIFICRSTSDSELTFTRAWFHQHRSILSVGHAHFGPRSSQGTFNFDSCARILWIWRKPDGVPLRIGVATLPRPIFLLKIYDEAAIWLWQPDRI